MSTALLDPRLRTAGEPVLRARRMGNALVIHDVAGPSERASEVALAVVDDPAYDLVVLDLPAESPVTVWEEAAALMPRSRRGVRILLLGRSRESAALAAQWLAGRLRLAVVVHDGEVVLGAGGTLFVDPLEGEGWLRVHRKQPAQRASRRFPKPAWETAALTDVASVSAAARVEPLPSGVWVHSLQESAEVAAHRDRLRRALPSRSDVVDLVLGCPGDAPLSLDDVARFWQAVPQDLRGRLRPVRYGPLDVPEGDDWAQALSDLLGVSLTSGAGLPVGDPRDPEVHTVLDDGVLGWRTRVREMGYFPRDQDRPAEPPRVVSHQSPVAAALQVSGGVFWYAPDAVVEVVPSGLWVRPADAPEHAARVRALQQRPDRHAVVFEDGTPALAGRMNKLAADVVAQLDAPTRRLSELWPSSAALADAGAGAGAEQQAPRPAPVSAAALPAVPTAAVPTSSPEVTEVVAVVAAPRERAADAVRSLPGLLDARTPDAGEPALPRPLEQPVADVAPTRPAERPARPAFDPVALLQPVREAPGAPAPEAAAARLPATASTVPSGTDVKPAAPAQPAVQRTVRPPVAPTAAVVEPRTDRSTAVWSWQTRPVAAAAAVVPAAGLDRERAWLQKAMRDQFTSASNAVSRVLSENPAFSGALARSSSDVLTDSVAVRLHLASDTDRISAGLRRGEAGSHVPLARCVVSGLGRLPSHRGVTGLVVRAADVPWALLRSRTHLTEWGFLEGVVGAAAAEDGDLDVAVWSLTARRTRLLEPKAAGGAERALFLPGTSFAVLEAEQPAGGARGRILLRELAAAELDADGGLVGGRRGLDELAVSSLRTALSNPPVPSGGTPARVGSLPGLIEEVQR